MANCYRCGEPIKFERKNGKSYPVNPDGSDHFDLCRETSFKIIQRDGVFFQRSDREGYLYKGREILTLIHGPEIIGKNWVETNCICPPWEGCDKCNPPQFNEADVESFKQLYLHG